MHVDVGSLICLEIRVSYLIHCYIYDRGIYQHVVRHRSIYCIYQHVIRHRSIYCIYQHVVRHRSIYCIYQHVVRHRSIYCIYQHVVRYRSIYCIYQHVVRHRSIYCIYQHVVRHRPVCCIFFTNAGVQVRPNLGNNAPYSYPPSIIGLTSPHLHYYTDICHGCPSLLAL